MGGRREADAQGGVVATQLSAYFEDDRRLVRLPDVKPGAGPDGTEALLNGLIEDCRFLIREVAFHSARLTPDAGHRLQFLSSAESLAVTAPKSRAPLGNCAATRRPSLKRTAIA
jgi:hypothetical protein